MILRILTWIKKKTKQIFELYDDPQKKKHYRNLKRILNTDTQKSEDKLKLIKTNIKNDTYRKSAYADLITNNIYTSHKYALEFIEILGFDINDLSKTVSSESIGIQIEDIKDTFNMEYNNICYKFGCKISHKKFLEFDEKEAMTFIKKIIKIQYGLEIKKDGTDYKLMVPMDDGSSMWKKLFEYKKNIETTDQNLNSLIEPMTITDRIDSEEGFIEE